MTGDDEAAEGVGGAREGPRGRGAAGTSAGTGRAPAQLQEIGGSPVDDFNWMITQQTTKSMYVHPDSHEDKRIKEAAAVAALISIQPRNELEGMLAAQMVACYSAAMACFQRAAHPTVFGEVRDENLAHAGRLTRSYAALVEAIDRRRGEGKPKTVTIEHRVIRSEGDPEAGAGRRAPTPRMPDQPAPAPNGTVYHKGNGHGLNGHAVADGAAMRPPV